MYHIVLFKIQNKYRIDRITIWMSKHEESLSLISEISKADCVKINKRCLGGKQYHEKILLRYRIVKEI